MPRQVLVLNATYEPINACSIKRAVVLVLKQKAEILASGPQELHSERSVFPLPLVIRLLNYVKIPRGEQRRISRRAVLARDGYRCQYCGSPRHLTLDHVVPKSRGGKTDWENVVTSCAPCNVRKGAKLPNEIGMVLRSRPRPPSPAEFLVASAKGVPDSWQPFLNQVA
ncbi:MAG: HNH endonuclease [Thermoleophilia bacterium]